MDKFDMVCRIRSECLDLKKLADTAKVTTLSYLLDMAALEAVNLEMMLQKDRPQSSVTTTPLRTKIRAVA